MAPILWSADIAVEFVASSREDALRKLQLLAEYGSILSFNEATLIQAQVEPEDESNEGVGPGVVIPVLDTKVAYNVEDMYE